jgi:hypothetical protein
LAEFFRRAWNRGEVHLLKTSRQDAKARRRRKIVTKERKERKKSIEQSANTSSRYRWILLLMESADALSSDA